MNVLVMAQGPTIRIQNVAVLSHHDVLREGLAALLAPEPDLSVVARSASADELLEALDVTSDAVVVIGHAPPDLDGIDVCRSLVVSRQGVRPVVLVDEATAEISKDAFSAGARACLAKDAAAERIVATIRSAADVVPSALDDSHDNIPGFGRSQSTVLRLLVQGRTVAEIAAEMDLSPHTVRSYLRLIYRRLGVSTRGEATAVALRRRLI